MRLLFRPLGEWPREKTKHPDQSPFRTTWTDTTTLLEREITHLIARGHPEVMIQVDAPEGAMRLDGGIRADARVGFHGVKISFESKFGPMTYLCDRYNSSSWARRQDPVWQSNVRAIALGLEALRKLDRYGITDTGQQYRGWQALPPGTPMPPAQMTMEQAAAFIAEHALEPNADVESVTNTLDVLYRIAAKRLHPDLGGDELLFKRLVEARDLLASAVLV